MKDRGRRNLLQIAVIVGVTGFPGCLSNADSSSTDAPYKGSEDPMDFFEDGWQQRPDNDPDNVPTDLECPESGVERFCEDANEIRKDDQKIDCNQQEAYRRGQFFSEEEVSWGGGIEDNWVMAVDGHTFQRGDEVTIQARNISEEIQNHLAKSQYNLQVFTESGWQDVRIVGEWSGVVSHDAILGKKPGESISWTISLDEDEPSYCPGLPDGGYRFAYYGFMEDDSADVIAVAWDVES